MARKKIHTQVVLMMLDSGLCCFYNQAEEKQSISLLL